MARRHKHTDSQHHPEPVSHIQFSPIREDPWRGTNYGDPNHHRNSSPGSLVRQYDSRNLVLRNLRRYPQLYLSSVTYLQGLFHLHLA